VKTRISAAECGTCTHTHNALQHCAYCGCGRWTPSATDLAITLRRAEQERATFRGAPTIMASSFADSLLRALDAYEDGLTWTSEPTLQIATLAVPGGTAAIVMYQVDPPAEVVADNAVDMVERYAAAIHAKPRRLPKVTADDDEYATIPCAWLSHFHMVLDPMPPTTVGAPPGVKLELRSLRAVDVDGRVYYVDRVRYAPIRVVGCELPGDHPDRLFGHTPVIEALDTDDTKRLTAALRVLAEHSRRAAGGGGA